jgi:molybdopterin/thiamine biosynthesis adenylyltransferase
MLDAAGLTDVRERVLAPDEVDLLVLHDGEPVHFTAFDGKDGRQFARCATVLTRDAGARVPPEYASLAGARVGIVGCGSLGSKVAAMLVRAGVRRLTLVDDDLMLAGNVARHELGATAVGVHKVAALKDRLVEIAGEIDVVTRSVALGGQESAESTGSAMVSLEGCDVIVDATADPRCFNLCAASARAGRRPMAWAEVFAGGIGGLIARVRPGHEPAPQVARNRIDAWCRRHGVPAPRPGLAPYSAPVGEGAPLVADDAEVTVIAAHLARLVTDLLVRPGRSAFPSPAYAIGLRQEWIFSAPFETWPIDLNDATPWEEPQDEASAEEALELLRELMPTIVDDYDQPAA